MLKQEWRKLLFRRRGLRLILALLALELLGTLLFTQPYDKELEDNRTVYERYLHQVEGPLTPESRDFLEAEMERLNSAYVEMESLKSEFYLGNVTEEAYRQRLAELQPDCENYPGFAKLYSQYIYVREAPEQRYFLYTGGWEALLRDQQPDYLLLLLLVIILAPVFCEEYSTRMDLLLLTQKRSANNLALRKAAMAAILAAVLAAIVQGFHLGYCAWKFGLPHGDYSLQSVMSFGSSIKSLTLWRAFWLQFALKEIGFAYGAMLVLILSVLLRKFTLTLMAGIAVLPLPLLTVTDHNAFLRVPGPWALTLGSIYLNGSVVSTHRETGARIVRTAELSMAELGAYLGGVALLLALGLWLIWRKNSNAHLRHRPKAATLCALLICACLLGGCGNQKAPSVIYNSAEANTYSGWGYTVIGDGLSSILIDRQTEKIYPFPLDAFQGETVFPAGCLYGENGHLYYFKETGLHPSAGLDAYVSHTVLADLDLETLEETVRFQWSGEAKWFFGLLDAPNLESDPQFINAFFLHDGYLYYAVGSEMYRIRCLTGQQEPYLTGISIAYSYDGQNLYYTDAYNRLVIHNLDTGEERTIEDVVAYRFLLAPEGIYFLNIRDGNTLYYWDEDAGTVVKLDDTKAYALHWDADYLWIESSEDNRLHRLEHDGTGKTPANLPISGIYCIPPDGMYFYVLDSHGGEICKVNKSDFGVEMAETFHLTS